MLYYPCFYLCDINFLLWNFSNTKIHYVCDLQVALVIQTKIKSVGINCKQKASETQISFLQAILPKTFLLLLVYAPCLCWFMFPYHEQNAELGTKGRHRVRKIGIGINNSNIGCFNCHNSICQNGKTVEQLMSTKV